MKVVWSRRAIHHLVALREYIEKDSEQNAALVTKRIYSRLWIFSRLNLKSDGQAECSERGNW